MEKLINEIMNQFNCTKEEANTIVNTVLASNKSLRELIINKSIKEYEV